MTKKETWRTIVASALDWEQAHAKLQNAVKDLAPNFRGKRPEHSPHSPWELLEHIRIGQHDLLEFCQNPDYEETLKWPDDYWPSTPEPPNVDAWEASIKNFGRDNLALVQFTKDADVDLAAKIPHGTGQTYLRTILLAIDHTSHHVGQLITVRRLLGAWPPK